MARGFMKVNDKSSRLTPEQRLQIVARLSAANKRTASRKESADLPQIQPDKQNWHEPFPLSEIQEAYLIGRSEGIELGNISCYGYDDLDVLDWDRARFESALDKMIARHGMLRCVITAEGRQNVLPTAPHYQIQINDLRNLGEESKAARLDLIRADLSRKMLPTEQSPLFVIAASLLDARRTRLHIGIDLLVMDGRSFEIFFRELATLYHNPDAVLAPLEITFRDYVLSLDALQATEKYRAARDYWMNRIPALPPSPELPLAKNLSSVAQPVFQRHTMRMDAPLWQNLKQKAGPHHTTPAGILLAAYAEVLAIWSKTPRFTLNLTLFNRFPVHPQIEEVIGDFTSVTLLEVDNLKPASFSSRVGQLQETLWRDMDHREFSGIQVIRELSRHQRVGPKAILPVVFTSLLNLGGQDDGETWSSRLGECVYSISRTPQVYLDCMASEEQGSLVVAWDAVEELFPAGLLDHMFEAFQALLTDLATDETSWERTLADNARQLLPATQLEVRNHANATAAELPDELLHTPFIWQVSERPDQLAVCTPNRRLTYRELYDRACGIETELLQRGVKPNQMVGVLMEKGWEQIAAVLGIHFAGGAYLPIDSELPAERQRYLIEHGEVKVVLTQSSLLNGLDVPKEIDALAVDRMDLVDHGAPILRRRQKPEDLAYIIYTSGSTGVPKGVMIDHRGAMNTVLDINQRFSVGPEDRVLALSRLNFDLSVYDIFGLLSAGGTIVMPAAHLAQDVSHWAQLVASEKVTVWNTVPALMQLLVDEAADRNVIGNSLRVVMMSGDWIPVGLPVQIRRLLPQAQIISMGGATEVSIWSILYPIENVDLNWASIPYGKPMLNQTFQVLNTQRGPCPDWVPGLLYIGGIGVAKGYFRDEQKTNASFVSDPVTGERLYCTGDLGRYLPDGNIEFLGREDFQVKVQGHRIELGEIETRLLEHPGVDMCIVTVREDTPKEKRLVGYVVAKPGAAPDPAELRDHLSAKLPQYMVPAAIMLLDRFPLTTNGKVDRKALPAPARPAGGTAATVAASRNSLELQLVKLWEKVLRVQPIGVGDNFFDLGGNSLVAMRLFSEMRKLYGRSFPLSVLFQAPTVEKLAEIVRKDGWSPRWVSLVPIQAGGSKPPFFCVHGGGGNILIYKDLAKHLGKDYPFYGLQARGVDGSVEPLTTVEAMADAYLSEMRELQPEGPYYLGGFCMGGKVAFEMARRLVHEGQQVNLLVMIDTYNFNGEPALNLREKIQSAKEKLGFHSSNVLRLNLQEQFAYLREKSVIALRRKLAKTQVKINHLLKRNPHRDVTGPVEQHIEGINDRAYFSYVPDVYPNKVTLFRPHKNYSYLSDPLHGWGDVSAGGIELIDLPVDPGGIFVEPYVQNLADGLRERIDKAAAPAAAVGEAPVLLESVR